MKHPSVSIVLIVHNTAPWLNACLKSIAAQSFTDFDVVIVDVASNFETKRTLWRNVRQLRRFRLITKLRNVGGAAAGNIGIREATGDYVFLMDSDDRLPPHAIGALHEAASRHSNDVTIGRSLSIVDGGVKTMRYRADLITWAKPLATTDLASHPELTMAPYYWGRLYRREMLLEQDVFMHPGRIFADRYFTCKALKASRRTEVISADCYYWRRDRGQDAESESITQRADSLLLMRDRVVGFAEVEALFHDPADAGILRYVRLSNLMRLFIHTRHLVDNEPTRRGLAEFVLPYARAFSLEEVASCDFLLARHKVQWYLIVNERWDDLLAFQQLAEPTPTEHAGRLHYGYHADIPGLPDELCTQYRYKIDPAEASYRPSTTPDGRGTVEVSARIPDGMAIEPLELLFKGSRPDRDLRAPLLDSRLERQSLSFSVGLPEGITPQAIPRLALAYICRGRYSTSPVVLSSPESAAATPADPHIAP